MAHHSLKCHAMPHSRSQAPQHILSSSTDSAPIHENALLLPLMIVMNHPEPLARSFALDANSLVPITEYQKYNHKSNGCSVFVQFYWLSRTRVLSRCFSDPTAIHLLLLLTFYTFSRVRFQVPPLSKCSAAICALERLFARVRVFVLFQFCIATEIVSTGTALVFLLQPLFMDCYNVKVQVT